LQLLHAHVSALSTLSIATHRAQRVIELLVYGFYLKFRIRLTQLAKGHMLNFRYKP